MHNYEPHRDEHLLRIVVARAVRLQRRSLQANDAQALNDETQRIDRLVEQLQARLLHDQRARPHGERPTWRGSNERPATIVP